MDCIDGTDKIKAIEKEAKRKMAESSFLDKYKFSDDSKKVKAEIENAENKKQVAIEKGPLNEINEEVSGSKNYEIEEIWLDKKILKSGVVRESVNHDVSIKSPSGSPKFWKSEEHVSKQQDNLSKGSCHEDKKYPFPIKEKTTRASHVNFDENSCLLSFNNFDKNNEGIGTDRKSVLRIEDFPTPANLSQEKSLLISPLGKSPLKKNSQGKSPNSRKSTLIAITSKGKHDS